MPVDNYPNLSREDLCEIIDSTPGSFWLSVYRNAVADGNIFVEDEQWMDEVIKGIVYLIFRAAFDDGDDAQDARIQMRALFKLVHAQSYSIPKQVIANLANNQKQQAFIVRGAAIMRIMGRITYYLEPIDGGDDFIGRVRLKSKALKKVDFSHERVRIALESLTSKATLQSLAIRLYYDELTGQGVNIKESTLVSDLKKFRKWISSFKATEPTSGVSIGRKSVNLPTFEPKCYEDFAGETRGGDRIRKTRPKGAK